MPLEYLSEEIPDVRVDKFSVPPDSPEPAAVREHLDRVLVSAAFRQSRRYAAVLRFMVERGLENPGSHLKEREIGTEVFGRPPDYDTSADHVVRSAAAEVRKRLAQYYQEEGSQETLRIDLQRGDYVPQFRTVAEPETRLREDVKPSQTAVTLPQPMQRRFRARGWWLAAAAAVVLMAGIGIPRWMHRSDSATLRFWGPLLSSNSPVLLCVGTLGGARQQGAPPVADARMSLGDFHSFDDQTVQLDDAESLARLAGFIEASGKTYQMASQSQTSYADLQKGPVVLVGLMNNEWTERLVRDLRFSVVRLSPEVLAIRDRENPTDNSHAVNFTQPYLDVTRDFAIVIRMPDPKTGQMVVTIAGLSVFGTLSAGKFVTDPEQMKAVDAIAPPGWEHKSVELLLSADVIRGVPGRATILGSRFW